jgi:hypothetical protein
MNLQLMMECPVCSLQVCLSVTREYPGCAGSSDRGQLDGVFFKTDVFGEGVDPSELSIFGSDKLALAYPYCVRTGSGSVTECNGVGLGSGLLDYDFDMGFSLASPVTWSGNQTAELGCFYITGPSAFAPPADGWVVGFKYSNTQRGQASMVKGVCANLIPFQSPVIEYNRLSTQVSAVMIMHPRHWDGP